VKSNRTNRFDYRHYLIRSTSSSLGAAQRCPQSNSTPPPFLSPPPRLEHNFMTASDSAEHSHVAETLEMDLERNKKSDDSRAAASDTRAAAIATS